MIHIRKRTLVGALAALALTVTTAQSSGLAEPDETTRHGKPTYLDARAPVDRRVNDLLGRMTLEEKVGQMVQIRVGKLRGDCNFANGPLVETCLKAVLVDSKTGSILSGGGDAPETNTPQAWAEMNNAIQRYALEHNRLKIPVIYGADGVHGHNNVVTATMFPHQIGLGATWDPELQKQLGESTGKAMRATGVFWNFAPLSDIARDTRWGRYYETYSEDPHLTGVLAAANVKGQQGPAQDTATLTATAKHFAGYSEPFNGHDRAPALIPVRLLQDTVLPPFQSQFDVGVKTVMINSGAINGVPVHASKYMLTTQLRERMGFKGVAVTDWQDIKYLVDRYHVAADYPEAIALSVNAGIDMAMEPHDAAAFTKALLENVRSGAVSGRRIDEAVRRVLKLKFELGLFEKPYVDAAKADAIVNGADRDLARKAAAESTVLLRNDGVLPLPTGARKLVVTGETADDAKRQLGGWTVEWQGVPDGSPIPETTTVLEGLRAAVPGTNVVHAPDTADAVAQAADSDAVVVVLGEKPGAEGPADTEDPSLTAQQQALVDAVQATGKPVVVVLLTGRPSVLGSVADANALVAGWLPGSEGGSAIADVLFGAVNPSAKLAVSWPKAVGDLPLSYDQLPGANTSQVSKYDPAYAFGHGLSYTSFTNDRLAVTPAQTADGRVEVSFDVKQLAVTVGDVDGSGKREVPKGAYEVVVGALKAPFTVR